MTVLRFRVMFEDDDAIFRDIEIKPSQTLQEFENVIVTSYNLPANTSGLFYVSNDNWQKVKPISQASENRDKKAKAKAKAHTVPMLVSFIDDPHQHLIYEGNGTRDFVFLIELTSLNGVEKSATAYPVMVRSQGISPFKKEEFTPHFTKQAVVINGAGNNGEDDVPEEEDDEPAFTATAEEADEDDLAELGEEEGGDLMEGDKIEEEDEDESSESADFDAGDDFDPSDISEAVSEDLDEDDLR